MSRLCVIDILNSGGQTRYNISVIIVCLTAGKEDL